MAFAKEKDVTMLIEALIRKLWSSFLGIDIEQTPFDRLTYESAMRLYGSDKPDRRIGMKVSLIILSLLSRQSKLIITDHTAVGYS